MYHITHVASLYVWCMSDDPDTLISLWGGLYVACIMMPQNGAQ